MMASVEIARLPFVAQNIPAAEVPVPAGPAGLAGHLADGAADGEVDGG